MQEISTNWFIQDLSKAILRQNMTAFVANSRFAYFVDPIDSSNEVPISNPS